MPLDVEYDADGNLVTNATDGNSEIGNAKYTIQIFALKNEKPVDFFADLVGVKLYVADGWYRYYVGEFNTYREAKIAMDNLQAMGYNPFIRKLKFFEK